MMKHLTAKTNTTSYWLVTSVFVGIAAYSFISYGTITAPGVACSLVALWFIVHIFWYQEKIWVDNVNFYRKRASNVTTIPLDHIVGIVIEEKRLDKAYLVIQYSTLQNLEQTVCEIQDPTVRRLLFKLVNGTIQSAEYQTLMAAARTQLKKEGKSITAIRLKKIGGDPGRLQADLLEHICGQVQAVETTKRPAA